MKIPDNVPENVKDSMRTIRDYCDSFKRCNEECPFYGSEYDMYCFFDHNPDPVDWRNKVDANS